MNKRTAAFAAMVILLVLVAGIALFAPRAPQEEAQPTMGLVVLGEVRCGEGKTPFTVTTHPQTINGWRGCSLVVYVEDVHEDYRLEVTDSQGVRLAVAREFSEDGLEEWHVPLSQDVYRVSLVLNR